MTFPGWPTIRLRQNITALHVVVAAGRSTLADDSLAVGCELNSRITSKSAY
jgi:hypothetical protein